MTKIKLQIKNRFTGSIIFEYEKENNTIKDTVLEAIKSSADLRSADLRSADLSSANLSLADLSFANLSLADLSSADLSSANLSLADLSFANLSLADLSSADLRSANLRSADLSSIKADVFYVLLKGKEEVPFLKKNLIEGKIDGSTYDGECACLSGTLEHGAKISNGINEKLKIDAIMQCRDSSRPAEMFFTGIKKGDTPETNQISKIVLEWVEEFESLINR